MRRRRLGVLVAMFATLAAMLLSANSASAQVVPLNGNTQTASGSLGFIRLTPPSSGGVFQAYYQNTTGSGKYVDFNLVIRGQSQPVGDQGAFTVVSGGSRSYNFNTQTNGACAQLVLYDRAGSLPALRTPFTC